MSIDLEQFHQVFFEEALEGLDVMEQSLLDVSKSGDDDPELINTIFRAAHSIKGSSGTFGFSEITEFTHVLETLLDEVRDGKRVLTEDAIELLLQSCDCLRTMVGCLQNKTAIDMQAARPLIAAFEAILQERESPAAADDIAGDDDKVTAIGNRLLSQSVDTMLQDKGAASTTDTGSNRSSGGDNSCWKIEFIPQPQILLGGNEPLRIFRELAGLGELTVQADISRVPDLNQLVPDECHLAWTLWLKAGVEAADIEEIFEWVVDECELHIQRVDNAPSSLTHVDSRAGAVIDSGQEEAAPQPQPVTDNAATPIEQAVRELDSAPATKAKPAAPEAAAGTGTQSTQAAAASSSSIRVSIDKVDSLINLVGELVITQSMLSELGNNFDMDKLDRLSSGLEQMLQNTKELQESVMRIRMLPISFAFNRFPRMIRDICGKTGKKVDLQLCGEQTELDKTVMEQISDPLTHLVRNALDHGIEAPADRRVADKPETGTLRLDAYHQGGNIVIEIADDGRGLDAEKILAKARDKGLVDKDVVMTEESIFELIFEPGFSTAETVSDISGRGVGMDVVRRNIKSLGGRVEVQSTLGEGTTFKVHLPLTLAILDGQLVRVGNEIYIIPLITIVESLQIHTEQVNRVSGNVALYRLREENVPIIPLCHEFGIEADYRRLEEALLVVVEGDGQKVGLLVDDLLAQQQVVIKSLESNYRPVEGISGATILGDGSVALILDVPGLIQRAARNARRDAA